MSYEARIRILEEEVESLEAEKLKANIERNTTYKEVSIAIKLLSTELGLLYKYIIIIIVSVYFMSCYTTERTANPNTERLLQT